MEGGIASWSGAATAEGGPVYAVTYADPDGSEHVVHATTVVSAFGYRAYNPLEEACRRHCDDVRVVGCAVKAGNAVTAGREGYEAGLAV